MAEKPTFKELENRIRQDVKYFNGQLPERTAIAWYGYLSGLIEWDLISVSDHDKLCDLLPMVKDNPATQILLGRPDED